MFCVEMRVVTWLITVTILTNKKYNGDDFYVLRITRFIKNYYAKENKETKINTKFAKSKLRLIYDNCELRFYVESFNRIIEQY